MTTEAAAVDRLLERLFPICRSITGAGVRKTLGILSELVPLTIHEVPSGTTVFDWTVPQEWNVREAYLVDPQGRRFADFATNNLHLMGYSVPHKVTLSLSELQPHLHSLPNQPDLVPYVTSYYNRTWGFCLADRDRQRLSEGDYRVVIDATLTDGSLTYGELYLPGETQDEVLLSTYSCHPSMANDNLSGTVLLTMLAQFLAETRRRYSYRLLWVPETIGALVWLSNNADLVERIKHGLVLTCVGDNGAFTYKRSRSGNARIDRVVSRVLKQSGAPHKVIDFFPYGSDERQFCSPGFNLPVGSLMRTIYYDFPEYHTSGDDLTFVKGEYLLESFKMYTKVLSALEDGRTYRRVNPYGEPQLGKRGLYALKGGPRISDQGREAFMWVLNYADGQHCLEDIAAIANLPLPTVNRAAETLLAHQLITHD